MGQVLYPPQWLKRAGVEIELLDGCPFPGAGLRTEDYEASRGGRALTGGWRISPASAARIFWDGLCMIARLPFVMLFVGAATFCGALKYLP